MIPMDWEYGVRHRLALRVYAGGLWSEWAETTVAALPEPATVVLLGGAVLALARRRRKSKRGA